LGEGLWAELNETGVDVLSLVLGATDTPAFRTILASRGVLPSPDDDTPIPGAVPAEQVAIEAIANLANGPTWFAGEPVRTGAAALRAMSRNDAVRALIANSGGIMNNARS
jgi:short-subunit dehydrogenase